MEYIAFSRKGRKGYNFQLTHNVNEIRVWNTKSSAEAQAQRLFAWNRNVALEVREIR